MLPEGMTIEALLPHRNGMLLIDEVIDFDEHQTRTRSTVKACWPLADLGSVQALILVELAAQTAGVNNGWLIHQRHGAGADHRGWIVGIKTARFFLDRLPLGIDVIVLTQNQFAYEGFREIVASATIEGRPAAEITLQLMQAEPT